MVRVVLVMTANIYQVPIKLGIISTNLYLTHLMVKTTLQCRYFYSPHFIEENTGTQNKFNVKI